MKRERKEENRGWVHRIVSATFPLSTRAKGTVQTSTYCVLFFINASSASTYVPSTNGLEFLSVLGLIDPSKSHQYQW